MPTESQVQTWMPGDVETLARFMGWKEYGPGNVTGYVIDDDGGVWLDGREEPWCPLTDANADLQVLERVREVWPPVRFQRFADALRIEVEAKADLGYALLCRYIPGCYARAALSVLKEMEADG